MNKYKIVALLGESGSGKDLLLKCLLSAHPELHKIIHCTTRPQRQNEKDGIDYNFLSKEDFADQVLEQNMIEHTAFRDWYYGTSIDNIESTKTNVGIFSPKAIRQLLDRKDIDLVIYRVRAGDKTRLLRQLNREDDPDVKEIIRRFGADACDFEDLEFEYIDLINETIADIDIAIQQIMSQLEPCGAQGQ